MQKQRHRQAGVQVASRTFQNLHSFFDWRISGGRFALRGGEGWLCMLAGSVAKP